MGTAAETTGFHPSMAPIISYFHCITHRSSTQQIIVGHWCHVWQFFCWTSAMASPRPWSPSLWPCNMRIDCLWVPGEATIGSRNAEKTSGVINFKVYTGIPKGSLIPLEQLWDVIDWCLLNIKVGKSTRPRSCRLRKEVQRPEAFGDGSQGGRSQNFPSAGSSAMSGLLSHVVIIINLHGRLRLTQTNEGTNMNQLFWRLNHPYTPWSWTKSTSTWIISQILASSDWAGMVDLMVVYERTSLACDCDTSSLLFLACHNNWHACMWSHGDVAWCTHRTTKNMLKVYLP